MTTTTSKLTRQVKVNDECSYYRDHIHNTRDERGYGYTTTGLLMPTHNWANGDYTTK